MSRMTQAEILGKFKSNFEKFISELSECFPNEADFKMMEMFSNSIPYEKILIGFVRDILPHKDKIIAKDEKFILSEDNPLFKEYEKYGSKIQHFKEVWSSKDNNDEYKDVIWEYLLFFTKLAERYKPYVDIPRASELDGVCL